MNKHAPVRSRRWSLQDAKAKFSELVRRAGEEGPQHITVHGREKVVVMSADDYSALTVQSPAEGTGAALIEIMRDSRISGLKFRRDSWRSPVRDTPDFATGSMDVPSRHQRRKRTQKG